MKKSALALLIAAIPSLTAYAQRAIAVETASVSVFYSSIDSAFAHVKDGVNVYLPGGAYPVSNLTISKRITVYGAEHYPDSTAATGVTQINGDIVFVAGADRASIQGIYLNGNIRLGTNGGNQVVNSISITRCNVGSISLSYDGSTATSSTNHLIRENVVRGSIYGGYAQNVSIENNLLNSTAAYFNGSVTFTNNIFLYTYPYDGLLNNIISCSFDNNIFLSQNIFSSGSSSNAFTKNVFTTSDQMGTSNISNGNVFNVNQSALFVNQTGNSFNYSHDYHLAISSPAIGIGTGGSDDGIYGGPNPYKAGAVPGNPHIRTKTIAPNTDSNGNLNINIKIGAQND